ncbi:MAG: Mfa1 family fimbria major subunit [Muribaculaceae bacterium]|nr:Mfa1 family fimbria major subunit [Muribaculaceae bacterium]
MKKLKTLLYGFFAAAMIAGCSQDEIPGNGTDTPGTGENDGEGYYTSLNILMPNGKNMSRSVTTDPDGNGSSTSSDGIEVGSEAENKVTSALIVLAKYAPGNAAENFGFIAAAEVQSSHLVDMTVSGDKAYKALARIQKTNLSLFYDQLEGNGINKPIVYVFVFCNPTKDLSDMFTSAHTTYGDTNWINSECVVRQGVQGQPNINIGIWGANSFLMNNVSLTTRELPASILDWENFDKAETPFHLSQNNATATNPNLPDNSTENRGAVRMERSVARFDFKDGSKNGDQRYDVLFHSHQGVAQDGENGTAYEPLVSIELQRMALVNMSNRFYYLRRVSDNGLVTGDNYHICSPELPWQRVNGEYEHGNYVVGPYADIFYAGELTTGFSTYFNYPFFDDNGTFNNSTMATDQWDAYMIKDVLAGTVKDNYKGKNDYTVWRYVTENVIPDGPSKQVNGISTGIIFKGRMLSGAHAYSDQLHGTESYWEQNYHKNLALCLDGKEFEVNGVKHAPLAGNSKEDPILYYLDGSLYMTWNHIRRAAIQAAVNMTASGVQINRSNSLYRAVFGEGAIPPGNTYISPDGSSQPINDPSWNSDTESAAYKLYAQSADYAWSQWNAAGKPVNEIGQAAPATLAAMRQAVTAAGISIYQSSVDNGNAGYYCYYYYWNRHNDNGLNGIMGPMEFDVVRNNVYKLSVDKISRLGHPRIPDNDPDDPTPDTPDESSLIYLDVNVQVTPWAVRVNSIEF